jgi:large subunit ribosomal protein L44e
MVEFPEKIRVFCKFCRKHTIHNVKIVKRGKKRALALGQRRFLRKLRGYTSFPRPKPTSEKPTKRIDLRLKCTECGKSFVRSLPRAKKFKVVKA